MKKDKRIGVLFSDKYTIDLNILKKSILAFDQIILINGREHRNLVDFGVIKDKYLFKNGESLEIGLGDYGALVKTQEELNTFDRFCDDINDGIKRNVIKLVNPTSILSKKARLLRLAYDYDLSNPELIKTASTGLNSIILKGNKLQDGVTTGGILHGMAAAPSGVKSLWNSTPKPTDEPFQNIDNPDLKESLKLFAWTRVTKVLTALSVCDEYLAVPITDIKSLNDLILFKYKWLTTLDNDEIKKSFSNFKGSSSMFKYELISSAIISDIFDDSQLENISLRKLIAYKRASNDELYKFKKRIDSISTLLENEIYDDRISIEIEKIINKEILPEYNKYIEKKIELKDRIIGSFIKSTPNSFLNSIKLGVPIKFGVDAMQAFTDQSNMLRVLSGVTISEVLFFSALFGAFILKDSVNSIVENQIENRKERRRNSLTYLLSIKK